VLAVLPYAYRSAGPGPERRAISVAGGGVDVTQIYGEPETLVLTLIGGFMLTCRGQVVTLPLGVQRLLAFLALHMRPVPRSYVAGSLWPESSEARTSACLRSALWRLRCTGVLAVHASGNHLLLADGLAVDTREIAARVRRLMDDSAACSATDLNPVPLSGELLPDWNADDWILIERERLRQLCVHGLDAICMRLLALHQYSEAVDAGLAAVRIEPLRESAHRMLIAVHLAEGNLNEALRQYRWYERVLRDELGLEPSAQITALVGDLLPCGVRSLKEP
jgi:DNA-binding SARP family transcriptional activator